MQRYPLLLAGAVIGATLSSSSAQAPPQKFEAVRLDSVKKADPPNGSMVQIVGTAANGKQVIIEMTFVTARGMAEQIFQPM
jgi:hypothetical protein